MLTNLAIACRNQGKFDEAETYLEESVRLSQKSLGSDHPDTLRALMNLSICIDKQGHYKAAEVNYRRVLMERERKLGLNHPYTLRTIERLAHMLWMQGHHDKAEHFARKTLTRMGMAASGHQPGYPNPRAFPALIKLYTEAWKRCISKLSYDHVDTRETCECLRLVYIELGEYDKATQFTDQIEGAEFEKGLDSGLKQRYQRSERPLPISQGLKMIFQEGQKRVSPLDKNIRRLDLSKDNYWFARSGHHWPFRKHTHPVAKPMIVVLLSLLLWFIWCRQAARHPP